MLDVDGDGEVTYDEFLSMVKEGMEVGVRHTYRCSCCVVHFCGCCSALLAQFALALHCGCLPAFHSLHWYCTVCTGTAL